MANDNKVLESVPVDYLGYYLVTNVQNICRVCLEKSGKLMPIFDLVKPPHFSVLMMACANVEVLDGDGLPHQICQKCISKLNVAFYFKTQCEDSDAKLREAIKNYSNSSQVPDQIHEEVYLQREENTEVLPHQIEPSSKIDVELINVQEEEGNQVFQTNFIDDQILGTNQALNDDQDVNFKEEFVNTDIKTESLLSSKIQSQLPNKQSKNCRKTLKIHQCDTCGKIFKTKPSLIHHIRTHTGERPYICHICQKRFINGGHLHTHMKTHTGEKNHVCVVCSRAFTTAQQLTKHTIAIHTSERPYACTYCTKRFASSSNLNTHQKIHTGEKNYHCEVCVKKFSTKGQLYQHRLVHTGEKPFFCEYCNKRFSQKAHLTRHLKVHVKT